MTRGGDPITNGLMTDVLARHRRGDTEEPEVACQGVDMAIDVLLDLVRALHDPDPDHLDHHDSCGDHVLHDPPCPHHRAQQLLAQQDTDHEPQHAPGRSAYRGPS